MIHAMIFTLALAGFILLLFAMKRHQQQWFNNKLPPTQSHVLRWFGFTALTLALVIAGTNLGWGYGLVTWCGWMTMAAAMVVAINIHRERILQRIRS